MWGSLRLAPIIPPAPAVALQVPPIIFLSYLTRHLFINLKFQSSAVKAAQQHKLQALVGRTLLDGVPLAA